MTRLLPLILIACLIGGCAAKTRINQESGRDVRLDLPDGTSIEVKSTSQSKGSLTVPKGTNGGSGLDISEKGNSASLAGWFPPLKLDVNDRTAWIFAIAGIGGLFLAAFLFGTKWRYSAIAIGIVSGGIIAAPTILQKGGMALTILTLAAGGAAAAYAAWRLSGKYRKEREREKADRIEAGLTAFQKLMAEGKPDEAIAARRMSDPDWDWRGEAARVEAKRASSRKK